MPNGAMWSMVTDAVVELTRTLSETGSKMAAPFDEECFCRDLEC